MHLVLVARCIATGAATSFPFFFTYLAVTLVRTAAVVAASRLLPQGEFSSFYWNTSGVVSALRFFVCWEVFRFAFPRLTPLRRIAGGALLPALLVLFGYFVLSRLPGTEKQVSLSVAAFLAVTFALAAHYGVPLPRAIWGMGVGMGLYASISLLNFTALAVRPEVFAVVGLIRQLGFILLMLLWLWALWGHRPQPASPGPAGDVSQSLLLQWRDNWDTIRKSVRKAVKW